MNNKVAVVEDEPMMNSMICFALKNAGFEVTSYLSKSEAEQGYHSSFDCWLLDIMLETPTAGFDLMKELRTINPNQAICFLSARDSELDKITGLEIGCDDYITKPFHKKELILRITNLIRRTTNHSTQDASNILHIGPYIFDLKQRTVSQDHQILNLTAKEFDLISLLIENLGRTLDRNTILRIIWDTNYFGSGRVLDDTIRRIRKKLPEIDIETVYAEGYRVNSNENINS